MVYIDDLKLFLKFQKMNDFQMDSIHLLNHQLYIFLNYFLDHKHEM